MHNPEMKAMKTKTGKIVKGIGGFYYVETDDGIYECRARGKFRKDSVMPYVGDNVEISIDDDGSGYVLKIFERKNCFIRPPVSNIDKLLIVSALATPSPDSLFIDKMLVTAECAGVIPALCFNKSDLDNISFDLADLYQSVGYDVFITSTKSNTGIDKVKDFMYGGVTAVCGFSGVGKSSLLNSVTDSSELETGEISTRLSRGKHTTRHVELIKIGEASYLADTPGFSMLSLPDIITCSQLIDYFPDLSKFAASCKFADCSHTSGMHCGVSDAVANKEAAAFRYDNYKFLYNTLKENKEWKK